MKAYKWITEDKRCFWDGRQFKFGWNIASENEYYSLTLKGPEEDTFAITGERFLPNNQSICMEVFYYKKDVIDFFDEHRFTVNKFWLKRKKPVKYGLESVPGIFITEGVIEICKKDHTTLSELFRMPLRREGVSLSSFPNNPFNLEEIL